MHDFQPYVVDVSCRLLYCMSMIPAWSRETAYVTAVGLFQCAPGRELFPQFAVASNYSCQVRHVAAQAFTLPCRSALRARPFTNRYTMMLMYHTNRPNCSRAGILACGMLLHGCLSECQLLTQSSTKMANTHQRQGRNLLILQL